MMQGCVLSPLLFNVVLETIMSREMAERRQGVVVSGNLISNRRLADDISHWLKTPKTCKRARGRSHKKPRP